MRKFTIIVLALGIALAVFAVAPTQQASADVSAQYYPGTTHWVQWGETLYSIGRLYNVSPQCIAHANGLFNPNLIYAGQALYIPYGCAPYPAPPPYPPVPPPPPPPPAGGLANSNALPLLVGVFLSGLIAVVVVVINLRR